MKLAHDVVQHCFARAVSTQRQRTHLHAADTAYWRAQRDEFRLPGLVEKGFHGLKEKQRAVGIYLDMVLKRGKGDGGEGIVIVRNAGIGNDYVEL